MKKNKSKDIIKIKNFKFDIKNITRIYGNFEAENYWMTVRIYDYNKDAINEEPFDLTEKQYLKIIKKVMKKYSTCEIFLSF